MTKIAEDLGGPGAADNVAVVAITGDIPANRQIIVPSSAMKTELAGLKGTLIGDIGTHTVGVKLVSLDADYQIADGKLYYVGDDAGDFDDEDEKSVDIDLYRKYGLGDVGGLNKADQALLENLSDADKKLLGRFFDLSETVEAQLDVQADGDARNANTDTFTLAGGKVTQVADENSVSVAGGYILYTTSASDEHYVAWFEGETFEDITTPMIIVLRLERAGDLTGELALVMQAEFDALLADPNNAGTVFHIGKTGSQSPDSTDDTYNVVGVRGIAPDEMTFEDVGGTRTITLIDRGVIGVNKVKLPGTEQTQDVRHFAIFGDDPADRTITGIQEDEMIVVRVDKPEIGVAHRVFLNHLEIRADAAGAAGNDIKLVIQIGGENGVPTAATTTASFAANTITVTVKDGGDSFQNVVDAINGIAGKTFTAQVINARHVAQDANNPSDDLLVDAPVNSNNNLVGGLEEASEVFANHLKITSVNYGANGNDIKVEIIIGHANTDKVNIASGQPDVTTAIYNPISKTLTVVVKTGGDTFQNVVDAINNDIPAALRPFVASVEGTVPSGAMLNADVAATNLTNGDATTKASVVLDGHVKFRRSTIGTAPMTLIQLRWCKRALTKPQRRRTLN